MDHIVDIVRAIGEPTRLRILSLLAQGEMAAGEMSAVLNQSQPRVSRHLKLLTEAKLIERRPEGAWVFFRLSGHEQGDPILQSVLSQLSRSDFVLARDQERLAQIHVQREQQAQTYFEAAAVEWETLRKLHQPDEAVESALRAATGDEAFDLHIDLGSGTGRMLELFSTSAKRSEGVDSSRKMLSLARARIDGEGARTLSVRQGDILALPYGDQVADLVTIHQVLHYLREPSLAVSEAARVLAIGGVLLIADFAPHSFEELREKHAHRRLGFSDDEVKAWCQRNGLDVVSTDLIAPTAGEQGLAVCVWKAIKSASTNADRNNSRSAA
jgi:ubiquinone/menaquinone biosynthesis C-methylase UbiE